LDAAVREIGKNVTGVQGDAGNLADLDRFYETVKAKKDHIDVLYASAGSREHARLRLMPSQAQMHSEYDLPKDPARRA
jgi:NAD(P)-dependent dehydrogenase (short-subunit alcohol dehydrogenase family)